MILNGELELDITVETNEIIDSHLEECEDCRLFVNELKKISFDTKNIKKLEVSGGFDYNLKRKLDAVTKEDKTEAIKTIPLFTRMVYYSSGVAAALIAFLYISSLGVVDQKQQNITVPAPVNIQLADTKPEPEKNITDSLEDLPKNISDDEELRQKVNAEDN